MVGTWLVAATPVVVKVTCAEIGIGNCTDKTKTLSAGFTNIAGGLVILIGMLAVIFIIISGLQIALSAGDAKRYQQGLDGLKYSVAGVVLAIMAYAIVSFIASGF